MKKTNTIEKTDITKGRDSEKENNFYQNINLRRTGAHLKEMIRRKGYTVKDIQRQLHLACPQPVYRWFKGQMLPSVDHLYMLSCLLGVHMDELLLPENRLFPMEEKRHMHLIFYGMIYQERKEA